MKKLYRITEIKSNETEDRIYESDYLNCNAWLMDMITFYGKNNNGGHCSFEYWEEDDVEYYEIDKWTYKLAEVKDDGRE